MQHNLNKLPSGLRVLKIPMPSVNSVTVMALCDTGSRYEKKGAEGIAHFFEHMVFKGTKNYPNAKVLAATIDKIGANFNAFTSKEYTGYYVQSAAKDVRTSLDVISDMMLVPILDEKEIEKEKGVIIEEMRMYEDTPTRYIADVFEQMFFSDPGLEHLIVGTEESVKGIKRQDFLDLLANWYDLSNLIIVISGQAEVVESKNLDEMVEETFSKNHEKRRTKDKTKFFSSRAISGAKLKLYYKDTKQAHFILGYPGINHTDERNYALNLLNIAFGGTMSSRLFSEVREKRGLCYYVGSDSESYHDTGVFSARAGVDSDRVEEAIKVIKEEFAKLVTTQPISTQELSDAKSYLQGKVTLSTESSMAMAQFYGMKQLLENKVLSPAELIKKYQAVTLDEVNQIARELVSQAQPKLAMISRFKDEGKFEGIINKN